jgi:hypothetical protein
MDREPLAAKTAVVALLLVLCVAAGGAVAALVRYDLIGFGHLPRTALVSLVLLLLVNLAARPLLRRRLFGTGQLLYVYLAVLVVSGFPGQQLVTHLYVAMVGPAHYASPENRYRELFFEHIPRWSLPSLQPEDPVIKWAFWGLPSGASLPWQPWLVPLACWSGFFFLLFANYVCLAGLFRRQWTDRQRMLFPLAEIPFQMARYRGDEGIPGPFRSGWFWLAFLVPVVIHSLNALHAHYPQVGGVNLYPRYLQNAFSGRPWNELNWVGFNFYFDVIGITYLLPADASFSLWFFWLFKYALRVVRSAAGRTNTETYFTHLGVGSYVLVAALTLWQARASLRAIGGEAWRRARGVTSPAPLEESEAVEVSLWWGFWATAAGLILFYRALGADWGLAVLGLGLFLLSVMVVSRIVSETGIYGVWSPFWGSSGMLSAIFGSGRLGAANVTALSMVSFQNGDTASLTLASIFQGMKVQELARLRAAHVAGLMLAALALGIVGSHPTALHAVYSRCIPALGWWIRGAAGGLPGTIADQLNNPDRVYTAGNYGNMATGAAVVLILSLLHIRYLWWPLHPLGWAAAFSPIVSERFGLSFLLGWILHRLAVKTGGYPGYRRGQPLVLGLIIGNGVTLLVWTVIHYFYPISGYLVIE